MKPPWTLDTILREYRFCNVRRMDDKVSKWLMENWYKPYFNHPNMLYAVALARFFNLPSSLELITELVFRSQPPDWTAIKQVLRERKAAGYTVFNGAYMVRGNGGPDKIGLVVDSYVKPLANVCWASDSMQNTHKAINASFGMGSFMAGQVVADLRHAMSGPWSDRNDWAPAGPGSMRGMNRQLGYPPFILSKSIKPEQFLANLTTMKNMLVSALPQEITRRLEMHDYQNCLCELDKYERALWDEGRPKQLYRGGK